MSGLLSVVPAGATLTGGGIINSNGGSQFTGGNGITLNGITFNNAAGQNAILSVLAPFTLSNGTVFNNNGTFFAQTNVNIAASAGGGTFNNIGTFVRDTATGTFSINGGVVFNNTGLVDVQTGTLNFAGGDGGSTTGDFNVAAGATLNFSSNFTFGATSDLTGAGTLNFGGGTQQVNGTYTVPDLNISGSSVTFSIPLNVAVFTIGSGTFSSALTTNVSGLLSVVPAGATLTGGGIINANGGSQFTGGNAITLDGITFNNAAGQNAILSVLAPFTFSNGTVFNNNGTFFAQTNVNISGSGTFNNIGTFTRDTAAGTFTISSGIVFNNTGLVDVQTGTLQLNGGDTGNTTGDFTVAGGATLDINSDFTFAASSDLTGTGTLIFDGGTQQINGTYTLPGLNISGASTTFNIPLNVTTFDIAGGTFSSALTTNVSGLLTWMGGTLTGGGVIDANGGISYSSAGTLNGITLNNAAGQTATMAGPVLSMSNGAVFGNNGTFLAQVNGFISNVGGGATFNNAGIFTRDTTSGTVVISADFNNTGTLNVQTGTLTLTGTSTSTGPINVSNSTLSLSGTFTQTAGAIDLASATLSVGGTPSFNLITGTSGTITLISGNILGVANGLDFSGVDLVATAGGTLTITGAGITFGSGAAEINGAIFSGGNADISSATPGGDGGTLDVTATLLGDLTVNADIDASSGANGGTVPFGGNGGTVNLTSDSGAVTVNNRVQVSNSAPENASSSGGNISVTSGKGSGVAIDIGSSGQLLALLDAAAPGPGGTVTILATGASSTANVSGQVTADHGTVDIRHTGANGTVNVSSANVQADIVKIAALGTNGVLNVGGGTLSGDSTLKLYAPSSSGQLNFVANVTLSSGSAPVLAAGTITINPAVVVTISGAAQAQIFTDNANYSGFGGTNPANGTFAGAGALAPQSLSLAPPFD